MFLKNLTLLILVVGLFACASKRSSNVDEEVTTNDITGTFLGDVSMGSR
jgi:hypothetical protein